jgi:hypothetical protein
MGQMRAIEREEEGLGAASRMRRRTRARGFDRWTDASVCVRSRFAHQSAVAAVTAIVGTQACASDCVYIFIFIYSYATVTMTAWTLHHCPRSGESCVMALFALGSPTAAPAGGLRIHREPDAPRSCAGRLQQPHGAAGLRGRVSCCRTAVVQYSEVGIRISLASTWRREEDSAYIVLLYNARLVRPECRNVLMRAFIHPSMPHFQVLTGVHSAQQHQTPPQQHRTPQHHEPRTTGPTKSKR